MKTLLLTGHTGFLGKKFLEFYNSNGWKVQTLGRNNDSDIFWDLDNREIDTSNFEKNISRIIHCAAINELEINSSIQNTYDMNVTFTRQLCDLAIKNNIKEFIYISTFHVYGKYEGQISTELPCQPINDYGLTHYLSEQIIKNCFMNTDISSLVLRPTNIYGLPSSLGKFNRWTLVPFAFIKEAIDHRKITLKSNGSQLRNFVDFENLLYDNFSHKEFKIIDIFGEDTLSVLEFANKIAEQLFEKHNLEIEVIVPEKNAISKKEKLVFDKTFKKQILGSLDKFIYDFSNAYIDFKKIND